jgi:hypothetical protein
MYQTGVHGTGLRLQASRKDDSPSSGFTSRSSHRPLRVSSTEASDATFVTHRGRSNAEPAKHAKIVISPECADASPASCRVCPG